MSEVRVVEFRRDEESHAVARLSFTETPATA
jgi:hypothetical protein